MRILDDFYIIILKGSLAVSTKMYNMHAVSTTSRNLSYINTT